MIKTIITFIVIFGILVFVHEFGHYFFAKKSGILVREFAIGMGPKIFSYHKNGTTYTIRILPIGGYVRMAGLEEDDDLLQPGQHIKLVLNQQNEVVEIDTSKKTRLLQGLPIEVTDWDLEKDLWLAGYVNGDQDDLQKFKVNHDAMIVESDGTKVQIAPLDVQYQSAAPWKKIIVNFAGPMNNFILAIVTFIIVAFMQGGVATPTNQVGAVMPHSVAQKAGLKANDQIIKIGDHKTNNWNQVITDIHQVAGKATIFTIKRHDQIMHLKMKPKVVKQNGQKMGEIGITSKISYDHSIGAILAYGFVHTWQIICLIFAAIGGMFTHGFSLNDLGGPVAMYSYTSEAAHYGLVPTLLLMAVLSVNLGIFNLLPIPALDGGKIVLNIIEWIRKKPLNPDKEGMLTLIGFACLMVLMVLVTWNDIYRFFLH